MGRTADYSAQKCSVASTLAVVGDAWTLLILRDAFLGINRFEQWHERLGLARNVLASRLRSLTAAGIVSKRPYSDRPLRHEYVLTAKGRELFPIIMSLMAWGDRHIYGPGAEPETYEHATCGERLRPVLVCGSCGDPLEPHTVLHVGRRARRQILCEAVED